MRALFTHIWHTCFFVLLLWLVGFVWFITLIPFDPINDHFHTDAIVVLTGGAGRIERGLELLAEGRADELFISGVENGVSLPMLLHQKENRDVAEHIMPEHITLGYRAHNTVGNAEETAQWITEHHIHSIRLITANIHMPRSLYEISTATSGVQIVTEPVFAHHTSLSQEMETLRLMVLEYDKSIATVIKHMLAFNTLTFDNKGMAAS